MNNFFDTIISSEGLSITSMLICTAASLLLGLGAAAVYRLTTRQSSRNMFVTMLVLPVLIQAVIMLVNGSIGAGVAVWARSAWSGSDRRQAVHAISALFSTRSA